MTDTDPEKLVKLLELELNAAKTAKTTKSGARNAFRIWSLVLVLGGLFAALCALQYLASILPKPQPASLPTPAAVDSK